MISAMHVTLFRCNAMRAAFEIDIKTRRAPNYLATHTFIL